MEEEEENLVARLALMVDKVVNEELVRSRRSLVGGAGKRIGASAGFVGSLARVVDEITHGIARDLDAFSRHAKRQKVIAVADVLLCARKNEELHKKLCEHVGVAASAPPVRKKGAKRKRDGEEEEDKEDAEEGIKTFTTKDKTGENEVVNETEDEAEEEDVIDSDFDSD